MPPPHPALGQVIRRLRTEKNLSQAELVRRSEVAHGTLWRIEHGLIDPRWSTVEKIAQGLNVSIGEIGSEVVKLRVEASAEEDADRGRA